MKKRADIWLKLFRRTRKRTLQDPYMAKCYVQRVIRYYKRLERLQGHECKTFRQVKGQNI